MCQRVWATRWPRLVLAPTLMVHLKWRVWWESQTVRRKQIEDYFQDHVPKPLNVRFILINRWFSTMRWNVRALINQRQHILKHVLNTYVTSALFFKSYQPQVLVYDLFFWPINTGPLCVHLCPHNVSMHCSTSLEEFAVASESLIVTSGTSDSVSESFSCTHICDSATLAQTHVFIDYWRTLLYNLIDASQRNWRNISMYNLYVGDRSSFRSFRNLHIFKLSFFFSNFIHIIVTFTSQSKQYKYI